MSSLLRLVGILLVQLVGLGAAHAAEPQDFQKFVQSLWPEASKPPFSISRTTFDRATTGLTPDLTLPDLQIPGQLERKSSGQAEFIRPPQAYLNAKTLADLATQGRALAQQNAKAIQRIEKEIGVAGPIVLAIWGRETDYGNYKLPHNALRVLATQAYVGRRKDEFRREFLYALKMVEDKIVEPQAMRASWAGAMGLTQFMPSEFYTSLKGLDGGRPDLFNSPADALASAANQLKQKGWVPGLVWGFEVTIPPTSSCALEGPNQARTLAKWADLGFRRADGKPFASQQLGLEAYLMSPGGSYGPSFLVTENYKVIRRYNTSDLYATFVGNLADRISGGGDFKQPWSNIEQLTERDVATIQQYLKQQGAPIEKLDGKIGSVTRAEIGAYERKAGMKVDCWPTSALLQKLKTTAGANPAR